MAMVRRVPFRPSIGGRYPTPFGGSDASRVGTSVRGNVVNLAARSADILQLPVAQVAQGGSYPLAFTPLQKRTPISIEKARDAPRRCGHLPQPCCTIDCAHRGISWCCSTHTRVPRRDRARLTFGLHFPHRPLILGAPSGAEAPPNDRRAHPRDSQLALSLRGVRIRH